MGKEGWISLYRKFLDWQWYDYPTVKIVFLHCLLSANHLKPRTLLSLSFTVGVKSSSSKSRVVWSADVDTRL